MMEACQSSCEVDVVVASRRFDSNFSPLGKGMRQSSRTKSNMPKNGNGIVNEKKIMF
jgi:hypothetical protein